MRKLNIDDVFFLSQMLDELDLVEEVMTIQEEAMKKENPAQFAGVKLTLIAVKSLHKAKEPIMNWLADIQEVTVEEVKELKFTELKNLFQEIFASEDIMDFFNSLSLEEQV